MDRVAGCRVPDRRADNRRAVEGNQSVVWSIYSAFHKKSISFVAAAVVLVAYASTKIAEIEMFLLGRGGVWFVALVVTTVLAAAITLSEAGAALAGRKEPVFLHSETVFRVFIFVIFFSYGASKIPNADSFAVSIANYRLLPDFLVNIAAMTVPWIETVSAVALWKKAWRRGGLLVTGGMNLVFIAAISSALIRGLDINCGCFTLRAESPTYNNLWQELVLNIILLSMAVRLWIVKDPVKQIPEVSEVHNEACV